MTVSVHWHNCGCVKYNNVFDELQWSPWAYSERCSETVLKWVVAAASQFGGPRRLSSWLSLSSRPWTCSAPTRWAVSMAAMSRWAYLMEPSSGSGHQRQRGRKDRPLNCVSTLNQVFCKFKFKFITCRNTLIIEMHLTETYTVLKNVFFKSIAGF